LFEDYDEDKSLWRKFGFICVSALGIVWILFVLVLLLIYGFRKYLCHDKKKEPVNEDSKDYDIKDKKTKGALKKNLIVIR
jgi:hypothetical protein